MQGYWEKSVKSHLEIEKRKYQEKLKNSNKTQNRMEVKIMEKKINKFNIDDIVLVKDEKGKKERYRVVEWFYEISFSKDEGRYEHTSYNLVGINNGIYLDIMLESELELYESSDGSERTIVEDVLPVLSAKRREDLTPKDIDNLLDQYNTFTDLHKFITSNGVVDSQYSEKADKILAFLSN